VLPSLGARRIYLHACLDDYRASLSIARLPHRAGLLSGFCASGPNFVCSFLQIPPHGGHPCLRL